MTAAPDRRAILTDALRRIDDLSARLAVAEEGDREPIAVVGMGCRLPGGVMGPDDFWGLLEEGRDGVVRVPGDRWDADALYSPDHTVPGTIVNREGGFLTGWDPAEFDAEHFGISPREAAGMDPQQRLLMEVAWEALEHGGIVPESLSGSRTGVYVGLTTTDYSLRLAGALAPEEIDPYVPFGSAHNFAAGRLSYFLGLRGPAVVLDTACSSSLTALHLAAQGLRKRETDAALVAGVNLVLSPENSIACSRWGMLAPDGRCKAFDDDADGYVRSEGAGVVVLKRLSDAQRDGDRVLAVVRGTAVNQDGASSGQTVPNGPAQQALIRQALGDVAPSDVDYIEAHGTGTSLGDPIELDTLHRVFGDRGDSAPLVVGTVKTNLGHLESAAGIAGFIKTVLALQHARIPRLLHFTRLTSRATEGASEFVFPTDTTAWPEVDRPRRAGVSSFGVSGTNAHVVVEQAPMPVQADGDDARQEVSTLLVSGRTPQRVAAAAGRLADRLADSDADLADIASALAYERARFPRVAAVVAADRAQAIAGLSALAGGYQAPGVVPVAASPGPGTVFVFSGQGSQWAGMGRALLGSEPAFAAAVDEIDTDFREVVGFSLRDLLESGDPVTGIDRIQPVLVGVQLALVALWRAHGVEPDAVIGHSMGEVAAAVVSGGLSVRDGLTVIATRSRLMRRELSGQGAMALLELDSDAVETLLQDFADVSIAVVASPKQTVVAGPPEQVDAVVAAVTAQNLLARRVEVDVASHHATVDPILGELRQELASISPRTPRIPVYSTVRPGETNPVFDAAYWADNLRRPVRFADAVVAAGAGHGTFVEISPHPILGHPLGQCLDGHRVLGTLARDTHGGVTFGANLLTVLGAGTANVPRRPRTDGVLPTMAWQHGRHWITPATPQAAPAHAVAAPDGGPHGWFLTLDHPARELTAATDAARPSQRWLVLADQSGARLAELLGGGSRHLAATSVTENPDAVRAALADVDRVVYAPPVAPDRIGPAPAREVTVAVARLAALLRDAGSAPRLTILTRNAVATSEGEGANPAHAAAWGAGRTLALELPAVWAGLIDVDAALPPALVARALHAEAAAEDREDQVVYRSGVRRVPRLRRGSAAPAVTRLDGDAAQLVVGATGNIGPDLVRGLAQLGAGTVVAVSRRGTLPDGLGDLGETRVIPVAADAADADAMRELFARFGSDLPPLDGVYLAALAGGAGELADLGEADVAAMFAPKVDAAAVLHELTIEHPVRRFVLFSSITGILGSRWLGHYTAANAYADGLAAARRLAGLPATVVDWGLFASWAEAQPETAAAGLEPMPNGAAVAALAHALGSDAPTRSIIAGADWPRLAEAYRTRVPLRVVDDLLDATSADIADLPAPLPGTLLGPESDAGNRWDAALLASALPYPTPHRVQGTELVPVSVLAATLAAAGARAGTEALRDIRFEYPVLLDQPRAVRVAVEDGRIAITSHTDPSAPVDRWVRHASAAIGTADGGHVEPDTTEIPDYSEAAAEDLARSWGVEGRPYAWSVTGHTAAPGALRAEIRLPDEGPTSTVAAALDAAVHVGRLLGRVGDGLLLPSALGGIAIGAPGRDACVVDARRRLASDGSLAVDLRVTRPDGAPWLELTDLRYSAVSVADPDVLQGDLPAATLDLTTMSVAEAREAIGSAIRAVLARELGMPTDAVDVDRPFPELGLDSMMAMAVLRDARALVGVELSATLLWDHPTVALLSARLAEMVAGATDPEPDPGAGGDDLPGTGDEAGLLDELFDSVETL
ncbi:type I polyketide synthase [Tsukamurella sp. 8F]|uniref:type I polyketide synthase n=1 Tax=unclassified Tsukamurella TaxID=2633480 RepID=UPI0023B98C0A|nr:MULTISPECIES: type I polyketide synthase [unclassified Tsukamurella]MDF0532545.1 type I polyketide synthase [Tsukamurella sp. 8J]MDF0586856.1 type I polyketide synthase [Tsukamurella sp. 8F]